MIGLKLYDILLHLVSYTYRDDSDRQTSGGQRDRSLNIVLYNIIIARQRGRFISFVFGIDVVDTPILALTNGGVLSTSSSS